MLMAAEQAAATPNPAPNPRVGCVLLDAAGDLLATGAHQGPGHPHAEVMALRQAGQRAVGATAIVTLEPCDHHGRTGPCSEALMAAGIRRVVYGQPDPNRAAAGGAERLRGAGLQVEAVDSAAARALNPIWTFAMQNSRPYIIWKVASTLDGRVAARDGSSRWITGAAARDQTHTLRSAVDAVIVGSGTVLTDDPTLTARDPTGADATAQPWRVVVGRRAVPQSARVRQAEPQSRFLHLSTRDLVAVNRALLDRDVHYALLEGGPELAAAYVRAGLICEVRWYVAPKLLGSGAAAVADIGVDTIAGAREWQLLKSSQVGDDIRLDLKPKTTTNGDKRSGSCSQD